MELNKSLVTNSSRARKSIHKSMLKAENANVLHALASKADRSGQVSDFNSNERASQSMALGIYDSRRSSMKNSSDVNNSKTYELDKSS